MDEYQAKALGKSVRPAASDGAAEHKIGTIAVFVLIGAAIILDVISIFEVPIADIIAWIIEIPILLYFWYTGASQLRQIAANVLAWVVELVPVIDFLPLYVLGMLLVVLFDRNETLARLAKKIPNTKIGGKLSTGGGAAGSSLSKNRMFGAASGKRIEEATRVAQKLDVLRAKVPGKLRTAIPNREGAEDMRSAGFVRPTRSTMGQGVARAGQRSSATTVKRDQQGRPMEIEENPLVPNYDREFLPELEDIVDVDVTGERMHAKDVSSVGIPKPKKVQ